MTAVSNIPFEHTLPQNPDGSPRNTGPLSDLGRDEFMTLLVTQLQNQDPTAPMENTEFIGQLAQFSALQEMTDVNKNIEILQLYSASINNSQALSLVGKTVLVDANEFSISAAQPNATFHYEVPDGGAEEVNLIIKDENGAVVTTQTVGEKSAGPYTYTWNGVNQDGNPVPPGKYTVEISGTSGGDAVEVATRVRAKVHGVVFKDGQVLLVLGDNQRVNMTDVAEIYDTEAEETSSEGAGSGASDASADALMRLEVAAALSKLGRR
ncbi:MAG: hypothetical protein HYV63_05040 [Candidatus Schekmanbacteria bacterium]|nr:hypothetical protein [Candidatus Schekmanbacteria bacterium]